MDLLMMILGSNATNLRRSLSLNFTVTQHAAMASCPLPSLLRELIREGFLNNLDRFQCGYYVMKYLREIIESDGLYLREIIESDGLETITSLQSLFNKNSYSTEEIDQVRTEWADCV